MPSSGDDSPLLPLDCRSRATPQANKLLLGTCYYHAHQAYRAYHLLKGAQGPQARYLFAVCCVELDKHDEAEQALSRTGADLEAAKVTKTLPSPIHHLV